MIYTYTPKEKDSVTRAVDVISNGLLTRQEQDKKLEAIQELFEEGFIVEEPSGLRKLNAQRIQQALWRTAGRMKPLDFVIHGTDEEGIAVDTNRERVVTEGVATVMERGGYASALRDKQGAFFNLLLYGDGFIHVGANPDDIKAPIGFHSISPDCIYVDNYATSMRSNGAGSSASKVVVLFTYDKEVFDTMWPDPQFKEVIGDIQVSSDLKDQVNEDGQETRQEDQVQVAYSYDLTTKTYLVFAGTSHTILQESSGDDYPFVKDGKAYIPIIQLICMPSSEGFYNHGIGAMIYKIATIQRQLINMEVNHVTYNTDPLVHINIPKGKAAEYFAKVKVAYGMQKEGHKGLVAMEYDPNAPNAERVSAEALLTQNLFQEWQQVFDRLDLELRRLGINIDELETTGDRTATEILALEENSNAFVKQVMEYNASESKFAVEITMDMISQFVGKKDKTPLNLTTNIDTPQGQVRAAGFTLGDVSEEIKVNNYFVRMNSRSGAIPSGALQRARVVNQLQLAQPGSPAYVKLLTRLSKLNDFDIDGSEYLLQQEKGTLNAPGDIPQEQPTSTDRLTIDARKQQQEPVL